MPMYAEIIPTQKLPRGLSTLTYLVPKKLATKIKVGQLATIPLRGRLVGGLIASLTTAKKITPSYRLKYLHNLLSDKIICPPFQIDLFQNLAQYYATSASLFVHFSLPKILKNEWPELPAVCPSPQPQAGRLKYFWWENQNKKNKYYTQLIQASLPSGQILILVPRLSVLSKVATDLALEPNQYCLVGSHLSRAAYLYCWRTALSGESKIFIGTRSASFLPYTNLRLIIVDEEHAPDHKQADLTPRYEVRQVCQELFNLLKPTIIFSSPSPSLESYHQFSPTPPQTKNNFHLVDLTSELENKNYTFLSDPLISAIKNTLAGDRQVFLFVNKKGAAHTNSCADCGYLFRCPVCSLPLAKNKNEQLVCYFCHHLEDLPPFCPQCGGPHFKARGLGTEKIAQNLKKILPQTDILILDSDQANKNIASASVIIGTEFALDKITWPSVGLLGVINADQLWQHAEFMVGERAYQLLVSLLTSVTKHAKIIIQTFNPSSPIIKALYENKPAIFYQTELKFRQAFAYPPFVSLMKISLLDKKEDRALSAAQKLYQKISTAQPRLSPSEPLPITRRKIRGQYKFNLLLKFSRPADRRDVIKLLPSNSLVDINPQTLLD